MSEAINLDEVIDVIARRRYERYDSHYSMPGGMTWEEYKADDPGGADVVYINDARFDVLHALPALQRAFRRTP